MTVMAAEAGEGAFEGEAADSSAAGRKITRIRPRRSPATRAVRATPAGRTASVAMRARPAPRPRPARAAASTTRTLTGNYHGAVFGEFVLAILLVAGLPFAKPNQTGVSPYAGRDMIQLLAVTLVYFLLAILAATGRTQARFAAWFGALMLLGIGLAETNNITSAVRTWLGGTAATSTATSAAGTTTQTTGNPSVVNAPSTETPTGISRAVAQAPGNGLS